ncbi:MAG: hypothetical protein K1060chlam1_00641 [Candidatus Anoxychlamydiales bacterium]|nr:hypothetical protein [Candidatus Anoxychlamydiales bacterium]
MKKKSFLIFGFAILLLSQIFAIQKDPCAPKDVCCEEYTDTYAFSYPKDIGLACPRNFYVNGEFLYMRAQEEGLEYAIYNSGETNINPRPLENGLIYGFSTGSDDWEFNPGFRTSLGFYTSKNFLNIEIAWTYLRIKNDTAVSGKLYSFFLMIGENDRISDRAISAQERWSGDHNILDLKVGKPFHVSRFFILDPFFGVRSTWIDQNMTFRYSRLESERMVKPIASNDFWGIGLRAGFKSEVILAKGFNIFASFSSSMLYGRFDVKQAADSFDSSFDYNFSQDFYMSIRNFENTLGISWGSFFDKNRYFISLSAAYEFHHWMNQNRLKMFLDDTAPMMIGSLNFGDLMYDGFAFKLQFDF